MNQSVIARHWPWLVAVIIAQLCDLATFLMGIARVGIGAETNGLARELYLTYGASGPLVLKLITLGALAGLLSVVASRFPERLRLTTLIAVIVSMIGVWGNITFGILR